MKRFVIIGLATAVTVPLIYALKKRKPPTELVQEEEQQQQVEEEEELEEDEEQEENAEDVERMEEYQLVDDDDEEVNVETSRDICFGKLVMALSIGFVLSKLFSRGAFHKILMARLNRMQ